VTGVGFALGTGMAQPMVNLARKSGMESSMNGPVMVVVVLVTGFILAALALVATHPLQMHVLGTHRRRND
jgi:hypothetical protein